MLDEYSGNERFPTVDERELRCIYVFSEDPDFNDIIRTIDTAQIPTNNNTNVSVNVNTNFPMPVFYKCSYITISFNFNH
jgi:hypothetical protein